MKKVISTMGELFEYNKSGGWVVYKETILCICCCVALNCVFMIDKEGYNFQTH